MTGIRELNRPGGVNYLGGSRFDDRDFVSLKMKKLAECRRALLRGESVVPMTDNDVLQANRQTFAGETIAKTRTNRKLFFSYDAACSALVRGANVRSVSNTANLVDSNGGAEVAVCSASVILTENGIRAGGATRTILVDAGADAVGVVVGPTIFDAAASSVLALVLRYTDASNYIAVRRTGAATWMLVERNAGVDTTVATLDTEVTGLDDYVSGDYTAWGMRIDDTRGRVFFNRHEVYDYTLGASAQAQAGTNCGFIIAAADQTTLGPFEVYTNLD